MLLPKTFYVYSRILLKFSTFFSPYLANFLFWMIASMAASQKSLKTKPGPTNYQLEAAFFFFFVGG
jgi:hypothetical protein